MSSLQSSTFSISLFLINCITHKQAPNASESKDSGQHKKMKRRIWIFDFVPPYISSRVHMVPNVLSQSLCDWPRKSWNLLEKDRLDNHPIVRFACLCHMISEESVFLSLLSSFFSLVAFYKRSAVTHNKFHMLRFPRWSSCSERTDHTLTI